MTVKDVFIRTIEQATWITGTYLNDLTDADLLIRPVPGMNHVAWQLGHLILSEHEKVTSLAHKMPELPAGFAAAHSKETASSDDPKRFAKKADYLALMKKMHEGTIGAIKATPDADFDKPGPESLRRYSPTVGSVFNLIGTHEFMHHGQIVALRRKLGKPVVI